MLATETKNEGAVAQATPATPASTATTVAQTTDKSATTSPGALLDGKQTEKPQASASTPTESKDKPASVTAPAPQVPEKYEFKGDHDPKMVGTFSSIAKEAGLSQEAAQKVLDKMSPAIQAQLIENVNSQMGKWADEVRNDPILGGDKLEATLSSAKSALGLVPESMRKKFESLLQPPSRENPNGMGLGNRREFIALMAEIGKRIAPDGFVSGKASAGRSSQDALLANRYSNTKD